MADGAHFVTDRLHAHCSRYEVSSPAPTAAGILWDGPCWEQRSRYDLQCSCTAVQHREVFDFPHPFPTIRRFYFCSWKPSLNNQTSLPVVSTQVDSVRLPTAWNRLLKSLVVLLFKYPFNSLNKRASLVTTLSMQRDHTRARAICLSSAEHAAMWTEPQVRMLVVETRLFPGDRQ
jgi:hypothetical protein